MFILYFGSVLKEKDIKEWKKGEQEISNVNINNLLKYYSITIADLNRTKKYQLI